MVYNGFITSEEAVLMMTVNEVCRLTGVSVRALQYYDQIGLLPPARRTEAGYRLYDEAALERLQQILLFRELEFPLKDIRAIVESADFDRGKALEQQIALLTLKRDHLDNLIDLARGLKARGVNHLNFEAFDTKKIDEYAARAKASWGQTKEYKEYEEKSKGRTREEQRALREAMWEIFKAFGALRGGDPASEEAQALVKRLQDFITEHMYACSDGILRSLGAMYAGGGDMTQNIDRQAGAGTAEFVWQAIEAHCGR